MHKCLIGRSVTILMSFSTKTLVYIIRLYCYMHCMTTKLYFKLVVLFCFDVTGIHSILFFIFKMYCNSAH